MFEHIRIGEAVLVKIGKNLDEVTSPKLRTYLHSLIDQGLKHIVLDMEKVSFAASCGLGVLCEINDLMEDEHGWLRLANIKPVLMEVISFVMLTDVLTIFDKVEDALTAD